MNENKLQRLFAAARSEPAPAPPDDFPAGVLRAVRAEPPARRNVSVWDSLDALFPRLALAAAVVIILCVAADWALTVAGFPGVTESAAQLTSQYLFDAEDL